MILTIFHPFPLKHIFKNHTTHVYLFLRVMSVIAMQPGEV